MTMTKRIKRLEVGRVDLEFPALALLDDLSAPGPLADWPENLIGVRLFAGPVWPRNEGEPLDAFRARVSQEIGVKAPRGAPPHFVEPILPPHRSSSKKGSRQ